MTGPIPLADAQALLLQDLPPPSVEQVPLAEAAGRVLARDIVACRSQPPEPLSAMDGYAVLEDEARLGVSLRVIGEAPAGAPYPGEVGPGEAVRIATGGVLPKGTSRVVIQEDTRHDGDRIRIEREPSASTNVRLPGIDFREGQRVAAAGDLLTPARLALVAAAGLAVLPAARRPIVAVFPSGDELREPGEPLPAGSIPNSGSYGIAALVDAWGGAAIRHSILPDDREACAARLASAGLEDADIGVPLGGASVGDRDALRPLFAALGASPIFEKIAVMPGKPSWHARFADGRLVLGLPGNPASGFVCAHLLLRPLIHALTGRAPAEALRLMNARLACNLPSSGARETYLRAFAWVDGGGTLLVRTFADQDSSLIRPLAGGNALLRRLPGSAPAHPGAFVEILPIGPLATDAPSSEAGLRS